MKKVTNIYLADFTDDGKNANALYLKLEDGSIFKYCSTDVVIPFSKLPEICGVSIKLKEIEKSVTNEPEGGVK